MLYRFPSFEDCQAGRYGKGSKVYKKDGALTAYAASILNKLLRSGGSYYPLYQGRGGFTRGENRLYMACRVLAALNVEYKISNIAPRGGYLGTGITFNAIDLCDTLIYKAFGR